MVELLGRRGKTRRSGDWGEPQGKVLSEDSLGGVLGGALVARVKYENGRLSYRRRDEKGKNCSAVRRCSRKTGNLDLGNVYFGSIGGRRD